MAVSELSQTRERMPENSKPSSKVDKKTFVIAQEIKLAKILAGNNKTLRERALRRLKRWFQFRSQTTPFTEDDFMRVWKGLFYAMWMSDKPLFQEECAEMISSLVHLTTTEYSIMFFKCGLQTLGIEWFGIDQLRLDKFLMLVRRLLRQGFTVLKNNDWNLKVIKDFNRSLRDTVLNTENPPPTGFTMHFTEVYLEELAKVSEGNLKANLLTELVSPFIKQLAVLKDERQMSCISKHIFHYLMRQSDLGMEYDEKFKAWKSQGFPGGNINSMQKEELSDEEFISEENNDGEEEIKTNILDPRAGHVDVTLPQLKFIPKQIIEILNQNRFLDGSNSKSRKAIMSAIEEFTQFSKGDYPLGVKKIDLFKDDGYSTRQKDAVKRLIKFDNKLLNKNKKRRKRKNVDDVKEIAVKKKKYDPAFNDGVFKEKLEEFIKTSEGKLKVKSKKNGLGNGQFETTMKTKKLKKIVKKKTNDLISEDSSLKNNKKKLKIKLKKPIKKKISMGEPENKNYQCAFERNSGTWFVYDDDSSTSDTSLLNVDIPANISPTKSKDEPNLTPKMNGVRRITPIQIETPTKCQKSEKTTDLFKQNEWDVPLKEGETEIFVESRKYASKMGNQRAKRRSLDLKIVKNPFAMPATPGSASKKVKIALNLNKSQDISDHVAQIKSSPGIPFDASRKPSKPLLKRHTMSPIDPFYKRRLNL